MMPRRFLAESEPDAGQTTPADILREAVGSLSLGVGP